MFVCRLNLNSQLNLSYKVFSKSIWIIKFRQKQKKESPSFSVIYLKIKQVSLEIPELKMIFRCFIKFHSFVQFNFKIKTHFLCDSCKISERDKCNFCSRE